MREGRNNGRRLTRRRMGRRGRRSLDSSIHPFRSSCSSCPSWFRGRSAFTLIELIVAVGLMALLMSMIATIFFQATQAFRNARASVEIHQNARAAYDIMLRDLAAATLVNYNPHYLGYFAIGWRPDVEAGEPVATITFTTLADQSGAKAPSAVARPLVALVRYTLEWNGGQATLVGDDPDTGAVEETYNRRTYNLVKRVRFPLLAGTYCDVNQFNERLKDSDPTGGYENPDEDLEITSDILAFNVVSMNVRILYRGHYVSVLDHGRATGGDNDTLLDASTYLGESKGWPALANERIRILGGNNAPDSGTITDNSIDVSPNWAYGAPTARTTYRIENITGAAPPAVPYPSYATPTWIESGPVDKANALFPMVVIEDVSDPNVPVTPMDIRMPYLVEITLRMTDRKSLREYTFTQRFHIPASEN